jgi:hypothetical protein
MTCDACPFAGCAGCESAGGAIPGPESGLGATQGARRVSAAPESDERAGER